MGYNNAGESDFTCLFVFLPEKKQANFVYQFLMNFYQTKLNKLKLTLNNSAVKMLFFSLQLLLGIFFSTRSVALIEDVPSGLEESKGYKSSAKFVFQTD